MTVPKKIASIKRFGARYGRSVKYKVGAIEHEQRKSHKCPKCSKVGVKRLSKGIWQCKKCDAKFAGRAYSPETTKI
ncbi:50S ribosomal protein L37ae [Candidatus Woesearchaeota archaeon]|nr:50S ribosomal protein L37ae [Candidatus Woesearchaeota archaeon]